MSNAIPSNTTGLTRFQRRTASTVPLQPQALSVEPAAPAKAAHSRPVDGAETTRQGNAPAAIAIVAGSTGTLMMFGEYVSGAVDGLGGMTLMGLAGGAVGATAGVFAGRRASTTDRAIGYGAAAGAVTFSVLPVVSAIAARSGAYALPVILSSAAVGALFGGAGAGIDRLFRD